ncbi:hypothetical protein DMH27_08865 [Raoultella planticola]|nr:hypothetical protein [Raoultella planticola]
MLTLTGVTAQRWQLTRAEMSCKRFWPQIRIADKRHKVINPRFTPPTIVNNVPAFAISKHHFQRSGAVLIPEKH